MKVVVAATGVASSADETDALADPSRLRRMDRFSRIGFVAGARALARAGRSAAHGAADARTGVVFGTAFGCRDSITEHAEVVATTTALVDLRPAVFAQTVHNALPGELAIAWRLGGISEVLVSGRTAGLEALIVAARRLRAGRADAILAGGADGLNDAMRAAWREERAPRSGPSREPAEGAAALVLVATQDGDNGGAPRFTAGTSFFEPDAENAAGRLGDFAKESLSDARAPWIFFSSESSEPVIRERLGAATARTRWDDAETEETFAASGPLAVVRAVEAMIRGEVDAALVAVRDAGGATAAVVLRS